VEQSRVVKQSSEADGQSSGAEQSRVVEQSSGAE